MTRRAVAVLLVCVLAVVGAVGGIAVADPTADRGPYGDPGTATPTGTPDGSDSGKDGMGAMMDMQMVENGTIVNENADELPPGCDELAGERRVTVRAGRTFAAPGEMFSFDRDAIRVEPCTRLTVTFVNEDSVRHQWMVHGLPEETYPMGMFNIEVNGPGTVTATLIAPAGNHAFGTHCSVPQHEQKGMHMDLVVGTGGDGHARAAATGTATGDGHGHTHADGGHAGESGAGFGPVAGLVAVVLAVAVGLRRRG